MQGRVRRQGNGTWMVVDGKENVYEAREKRRRWQGETQKRSTEQGRPHFCYKEVQDRGVSATCRRCRVEREGMTHKPVPSCARPVSTGMGVWRETPMVAKGREGVMERRLRNHPLDCPVCDQGGECDLQEQTRNYGTDRSRRYEGGRKRGVEDKEVGGQVKRVMTRCIHCTRCVRYSQGQRGMRGRGRHSEIGRYAPWKRRENPRSGGRVDRCPVGARTQEKKKFADRPWERETVESVNRRDGRAQPVSLTYRGGKRMEVKPKRGTQGGKEILSDKARYGRDGREHRRLFSKVQGAYGENLESRGVTVTSSEERRKTANMRRTKRTWMEKRKNSEKNNLLKGNFHGENLENLGERKKKRTLVDGNQMSTPMEMQTLSQRKSRKVARKKGTLRRGSGRDRERGRERKQRNRQGEREQGIHYKAGGERKSLRRHRGERTVSTQERQKKRHVGREREEVRPTRTYGATGREKKRGVGTGKVAQRNLKHRKGRADGLQREATEGRRRGSSRWKRADGRTWRKKTRGGKKKTHRRIHQSNALGRRTL